jgi:fatty acid desaturase
MRYRADLRPLAFNALYVLLLASVFVGPKGSWSAECLRFVLLCVTSFQGAVQTHNAVHSPVFRSRRLNKFYQCVLTLTYGHPVSSYVPGHNLSHHKHTQSRKDVMRTTRARFRWNLLNGLLFFFLTLPNITRADSSYTKAMRKRHPRWFRQAMAEFAVLWLVQVGLFVCDWKRAIVFWVLPHAYAAWGIVTMNLLQHDGCDERSAFDHSRNFVGSIVNWLTFNNGYHTIHHAQPGLHWSLLPAAHALKVAPYIHHNLEQRSLLAYIGRTYLWGKRLRFDGSPYELPEEGPDEPWIPDPRTTGDDLGVESIDVGSEPLAAYVAHVPSAIPR